MSFHADKDTAFVAVATAPPAVEGNGGAMSQPLRFGIVRNQDLSWPTMVRHWRAFEELGFDSIWHADHYQRPSIPEEPFLEGWTLLSALALKTTKPRIGILVTSNTFRHPPLLAKQAVTVDHISNGRLELGIGTGWFQPEHERYGVPFPEPPELVARFQEAVILIDKLLTSDVTSFAGTYYSVTDAPFRPAPLQRPRPPLTLGAHGPRMLRFAARFADRWNSYGTVADIEERNARLDEECAAIGRDPQAIIRSLYGWTIPMGADPWDSPDAFADVVGRYREAGMSEFLMEAPQEWQFPVMERIASDLLPTLRSP
jgi:alkanesulfonate monooxygenase SsuD/methylene tetrahydromethanopterin reductase-like flavin-dependent oxidoreductase (luciferase family)